MVDDSLASLLSHSFVLVAADTSVAAARSAVPIGYTAVVMGHDMPIGVLNEERLLAMPEPQQPLTYYRDDFYTPTLSVPGTPLLAIMQAMLSTQSVRWHVVVDKGEIVGVVPPAVLLELLAQWQQKPPKWLTEPLQALLLRLSQMTLGSLLNLPGDPLQPPPQLCARCPASTPAHQLAWHEVDYTNPLAPACSVHPGTRIVWVNPC